MTSIAPRVTRQVYSDHKAWVYADISLQPGRASITLDLSKFVKGTHYPKGFVPSGIPLGKITATGLYGPYDNSATDGREVCAGFLWAHTDDVVDANGKTTAALWFGPGAIQENELPVTIDAAGKTDLASWFKFF
ncbi:head decoration [Gordonia phage OneUp]|uniref:Head decoration protein n=1 Tax=Gordonia phage OneUp TaxID=1838074 RepID=A0A166Y8Z4_9CAUD|nr:head decoration [Gordonia phage OneUp]ANA86363.1 head decoration protein [Gordonia phage OneUp]